MTSLSTGLLSKKNPAFPLPRVAAPSLLPIFFGGEGSWWAEEGKGGGDRDFEFPAKRKNDIQTRQLITIVIWHIAQSGGTGAAGTLE